MPSSYEIGALLGGGGMGEVYKARDTRLGRDVALKILPSAFTSDPERLARLRREAQVLASLNHQHIGTIYGLDDADGTQFLVLELVDVLPAIPLGLMRLINRCLIKDYQQPYQCWRAICVSNAPARDQGTGWRGGPTCDSQSL